jgi:RAT1-interacting protein
MVFHPLYPPQSYSPAAGVQPTPVGLPTQLTSFSYSPTRELLLDDGRQDEALQHYKAPPMGADLNRGFEECEWGEGRPDEGLDALLLR